VHKLTFPENTHTRALLLLFAVSIVILFVIGNRGATRGFFYEDDFDNLANARGAEAPDFLVALIKPMVSPDSAFRPVATFYYYVMGRTAALHFAPYIYVIQAIHLGNFLSVWLLARTLGANPLGACAGAMLFVFHSAMFHIYWRPMYVFDLLCATFVLLTVLTYRRGSIFPSLIFFWLALKSKELAIFLPLILIAYEWFFEQRRWRRVAPFLATSAVFGIWALVYNAGRNNDYSLRFAPAPVWTCTRFYAEKLVSGPAWIGLAALACIFLFARNRLVRIGLVTFFSMMLVMLALPGRMAPAYLYTAWIGLAIAMSAVTRPAWAALFFVVWIPWNYRQLRIERRAELAAADERRGWFEAAQEFVKAHPAVDAFVYQNRPETMGNFGIPGALRCLRPPGAAITVADAESPGHFAAMEHPNLVVIAWNPVLRKATLIARAPDVAYIELNDMTPLWQLGEGWMGNDYHFRWMAPHAAARLVRPASASAFEVVTGLPPNFERASRLTVSLDHQPIGTTSVDRAGLKAYRFEIPKGSAGTVDVEMDVSPPIQGGTTLLGLPITSFGFK